MKRLVVIGNGMAGVYAVEEILKIRRDLSITIFGEEPHFNYNRILLSEVLAGERSPESICLNPREWYDQNLIDLRLGTRVTAIDPLSKTVADARGQTTSYDFLLIAVGGVPFIPPIQGADKAGVFVFRNLEDTHKILAQTRLAKEAVVIGGGLLGLEAARALINHGVSVTVVHLMDRLMEQQLDTVGAGLLKRQVERLGIGVILNSTAQEILGEPHVRGVRLTTGQKLSAGMVLICTGIRPNLELARSCGLLTNRGIVVDDRLQTSVADIYAVGDVIEHRGKTYGLVAPLRDQARVVADQMVGQKRLCYEGTVCATTLKVAGIHLTSAGAFSGGKGLDEMVYLDTQAGIYKKLVFEQNRLTGMILLGDHKDTMQLFNLIQSGQDVSAMKDRLIRAMTSRLEPNTVSAVSTVSSMADTELICNCHTVTKGVIMAAIRDRGLKTRDEVATLTKASTGCGGCTQLVEDLLIEANTKKPTPTPPASMPRTELHLTDKPLLGYPTAYPKSLDVERIKQEGLGLDFDRIRENGVLALTEDDYYRLKTYGVCSQKHPGYFMLRIRIPGGQVTAQQLLILAERVDIHGRGWGHLTTRQDLELHWVHLEEVPEIWEKLEAIGLSTRSACGHTLRNVMACPHAAISPTSLIDVRPWAKAVTDFFLKRSDLINPSMPNRLNIFFAGCLDCTPHAQINDIGFVAVKRPGEKGGSAVGFELWAGGSLGAHPMLGFRLKEFIPLEDALPACQAIFYIHTRYGNRTKAKSRLKWLVDQWGQEKFKTVFEKVFQGMRTLPENREFAKLLTRTKQADPLPPLWARIGTALVTPLAPASLPPGCRPQRQAGYVWLTVEVPLGEIRGPQLRSLARVSRRYGNGEVHLNQDQNVELHWIKAHTVPRVIRALNKAGLRLKGQENGPRVVACPGTEFCVLAVTNAQGAAKDILKRLISNDPVKAEFLNGVSIHISGCPNSCAKHQVADIGLAGTMSTVGDETLFSYMLYLGGHTSGGIRLGQMIRKGITEEMLLPTLEVLVELLIEHRQSTLGRHESFQQIIDRLGTTRVAQLLQERLTPFLPEAVDRIAMVTDQVEISP